MRFSAALRHAQCQHTCILLKDKAGRLQRRRDWAKFDIHSNLPIMNYFEALVNHQQNKRLVSCPLPSPVSTSCVAKPEQEEDTGLKSITLFSEASPSSFLLCAGSTGSLTTPETGLGQVVVDTPGNGRPRSFFWIENSWFLQMICWGSWLGQGTGKLALPFSVFEVARS